MTDVAAKEMRVVVDDVDSGDREQPPANGYVNHSFEEGGGKSKLQNNNCNNQPHNGILRNNNNNNNFNNTENNANLKAKKHWDILKNGEETELHI